MTVRERIKIALDRSGKSQGDLANALNVKQGTVSGVLNRDSEFDSIRYLEATEQITGFRFEWLRTGNGPEKIGDIPTVDYRELVHNPSNVNEPLANIFKKINDDIDERSPERFSELLTEVKHLKIENEVLRSALREIGAGRGTISQREQELHAKFVDEMKLAEEELRRSADELERRKKHKAK